MMQGTLVKFDLKTEKFQSWGSPTFLARDEARITMVAPTQAHLNNHKAQLVRVEPLDP